jgi:ADP-ribosylglycohydrolase
MIGAIAGDIIGSVYERNPIKTTHFPLFSPNCCFTDDTVLTEITHNHPEGISENFEDAIRKAISLGGDSDTLACITGAGWPTRIMALSRTSLPKKC